MGKQRNPHAVTGQQEAGPQTCTQQGRQQAGSFQNPVRGTPGTLLARWVPVAGTAHWVGGDVSAPPPNLKSNEALQIICSFCFLLKYKAMRFQEKEEGERAGLFSYHFKNKADLKTVSLSNKAREIPAPKKTAVWQCCKQ